MTTERTASCLCGGITIKMTGEQIFRNVCYCSNCVKASGSICPGYVVFPTSNVEITDPSSLIKTYRDTGTNRVATGAVPAGTALFRSFCSGCGSRVRNQPSDRLEVSVIPVGIVDGDKGDLEPGLEFWTSRKPGWFGGFEGTKRFEAGMK